MRPLRADALPVGPVLAPCVCAAEVESVVRKVRLVLVEPVSGRPVDPPPELPEVGVVLRREPREIFLAKPYAGSATRPYAIDAMREKKMSVWIHKPPLAVHLLCSEEARRIQLRSASPAAESVGIWNWTCMSIQPRILVLAGLLQLSVVVYLSRPVVVRELSVFVDERQESGGQQRLLPHARICCRDPQHAEAFIYASLDNKDVERAHTVQIECRALARRLGKAPHAVK